MTRASKKRSIKKSVVSGRNSDLATAIAAHQRGDLEAASKLYRTLLKRDPRNADSLHLLGLIAHQQGRHAEAVEMMTVSLSIEPNNAVCHCNLGAALIASGQPKKALEAYERSIEIDPFAADAFVNKGLAHIELGDFDSALRSFDDALIANSVYIPALYHRAKLLPLLGRIEEADSAITAYAAAIGSAPENIGAINDLGLLLIAAGREQEAIEFLTHAISAEPSNADLYFSRGNAFAARNRHQEACADFDRVLLCMPDHIGALNNRGNSFFSRRMFAEALENYRLLARKNPELAIAHYNEGNALHELGKWGEALKSWERVLELNPSFDDLPGKILHLRGRLGNWQGEEGLLQEILHGVMSDQPVSEAFPLFMVTDDQAVLKKATHRWVRANVRSTGRLGPIEQRSRNDKIHIAYLSGDFHEHATSYLTAEMFERHDRERFEVTAISFGPDQQSGMRKRLIDAFDRFEDVRHLSDLAVAARCRELKVDIAIDLKAYLQDRRPNILTERCAPIQVNWLAFPGTMAAPHIDYIVADQTLITPDDLDFYTEKVIWLPNSYQVNDGKRAISSKTMSRAECGLPPHGFVYCCFNNGFKIRPDVFNIWMRILQRTPGSVLWLLGENDAIIENLRREAGLRGVDPSRLVFAPRLPMVSHLARHRNADLFLDTWPCNAHTTASDALWTGLPVLTRIGNSFSSRVASSLLRAVGIPELIMRSNDEYENTAVMLANNPSKLRAIKNLLNDTRSTCPLFDSVGFAQNLENAYLQVMERYWSGLAPDHISVAVDDINARIADGNVEQHPLEQNLSCLENLRSFENLVWPAGYRANQGNGDPNRSVQLR